MTLVARPESRWRKSESEDSDGGGSKTEGAFFAWGAGGVGVGGGGPDREGARERGVCGREKLVVSMG